MRRAMTTKAVEETSEREKGDPLVPVEQIAAILDNVKQLNSVRYAIQLHPSLGDPHQWKVHRQEEFYWGEFYWEFTSSIFESIRGNRAASPLSPEVSVFGKSIEEVVENGCAEYLAHNPIGIQATRLQREEWAAGWLPEPVSANLPNQRLIDRSHKEWKERELGNYADHFVCDDPQGSPIDVSGRFLLRQYYKHDRKGTGEYVALYGVLDRLSGKLAVASNVVDVTTGYGFKLKDVRAMASARALRYLDENPVSS